MRAPRSRRRALLHVAQSRTSNTTASVHIRRYQSLGTLLINMSSLGEGRAFDVSCDLHRFRSDMGGRHPDDSLQGLNCSFGNAQSWKPREPCVPPRCNGDTSQVTGTPCSRGRGPLGEEVHGVVAALIAAKFVLAKRSCASRPSPTQGSVSGTMMACKVSNPPCLRGMVMASGTYSIRARVDVSRHLHYRRSIYRRAPKLEGPSQTQHLPRCLFTSQRHEAYILATPFLLHLRVPLYRVCATKFFFNRTQSGATSRRTRKRATTRNER